MSNKVIPCEACRSASWCKVYKRLAEAKPEERWALLNFVYEHSTAVIITADDAYIKLECPRFRRDV